MSYKHILLVLGVSLTIIGCGVSAEPVSRAVPRATTAGLRAKAGAGVWAMVCSKGQLGGKTPSINDNAMIRRKNCRVILGHNRHLTELFTLLRSALIPDADCRARGFGLDRLRLLVVSSQASEAIVDASRRFSAFAGCGHLTRGEGRKLERLVKRVRSPEMTERVPRRITALVCFEPFSSESYIATTRSTLLLGGSCRSSIKWPVRIAKSALEILDTPAMRYTSCKSSDFAEDNLRLFIGRQRGSWYWADSTGAVKRNGQCGKLSAEQMQKLGRIIAPEFNGAR